MWTVTTTRGDLPDEYERREHLTSVHAWNDYQGRILQLEIDGFVKVGEESTKQGREWVCDLYRGHERIAVTIQRAS
jgi:hypothetical protein